MNLTCRGVSEKAHRLGGKSRITDSHTDLKNTKRKNTKRKDLENPFPLFKRKPEIWNAPKNSEEKVSAKNVQNMPSFYTQGERARKKVASSNVLIFLPPALRAPKGREKEGEGGPCVVVYPFPRRREAQSAGLPDVLAQMPFGRSMHPDVEGEVTSL